MSGIKQCICEKLNVTRKSESRCLDCPKREGSASILEIKDKIAACVMGSPIDPKPALELQKLLVQTEVHLSPLQRVTLLEYVTACMRFRQAQYEAMKVMGLISTEG